MKKAFDRYGSDWKREFTVVEVVDGKEVEKTLVLSEMSGVDLIKSYSQKYPDIDWKAAYRHLGDLHKLESEDSVIISYYTLDLRSYCRTGKVKGLYELTKRQFDKRAEETDLKKFTQAAIMLQRGECFAVEYYDPETEVPLWGKYVTE